MRMPLFPNVEAFILAGGKSSRMGRDKTLLELEGEPLVQRAATLVVPLVSTVTLVTSAAPSSAPDDTNRHSTFGLPTLTDRWPNAGPLGGIATALAGGQSRWCLILACDMPFLNKEWMAFLLGKIGQMENESAASQNKRESSQQYDVIMPETSRGLEPLCAVYRSICAPIVATALDSGIRKVTDALATLNLKRVSESDWRQFSPDGNLFGNLNTWQDYLEAQKRFKA
jgi:molybdopterin-guanine dinucleotide biosynthesis protein A